MANEIIEVKSVDVIQAIDRAEVDVQIATAKQYPRDVAQVLNKIRTYGQMDVETAGECFYSLPRGNNSSVEGVSVRFAEIVAGAWGNLRVATRIIGNDGKTITAQGVAHDLETNLAVSVCPNSVTAYRSNVCANLKTTGKRKWQQHSKKCISATG